MKIGIISDTHGTLPLWVITLFKNLNLSGIIHAGDIVDINTIIRLKEIAPLTAVKGNMDIKDRAPVTSVASFDNIPGFSAYVLHDLYLLDIDPKAAGIQAVIYGHTHIPKIEWINDVLYFNPGSPVFPRGGFKESVGILEIKNDVITPFHHFN
ncbi:MAG: metallophosphoesterase family protein [Deltaproteobacteria bacterium]|nr:metallophosphoesterase family protein [Deltaproteobacteria bacterium]